MSAYNAFMKSRLKGKLSGKSKTERTAIFKAAAAAWSKSHGSTGTASAPKRAKHAKRASPAQRKARAAFAKRMRGRHRARGVGRGTPIARPTQADLGATHSRSLDLPVPGWTRTMVNERTLVPRGDPRATPIPVLNGETNHYTLDPMLPSNTDGHTVDQNRISYPLTRR